MSDPKTRAHLRGHVAAELVARALSLALAGAAVVALFWKGLPAALALALAAGFFSLARPGPSDTLDEKTGRR